MSQTTTRLIASVAVALLCACEDNRLAPEPELPLPLATAAASASPLTTTPLSESEISITWADNVGNETGWELHRSTTGASGTFRLLMTYGANSVQDTDDGLAPLTEYCYKVRSFRRQGRKVSYSAFTTVSCSRTLAPPTPPDPPPPPPPPPPPAAPSGVNAMPMSGQTCCSAITISWTDNSTDETGFQIERAESPEGPWTFVAGATQNGTSSAQYNVPVETKLCYRLLARRDTVLSEPSNVDCTHFPATASGLAASASGDAIDVTWLDNSAVEDAYVIERATGGYEPPGFYGYTAIATLPANTATFRDAAVSANTRYWYRVWVMREGAKAAMSNAAFASIAISAPEAPFDARAVPYSSSGVTVRATPGGPTVADGYRLERSADGVSGWIVVATHTSPGIADVGRQPEQNVCYRMIALNTLGESPPSNVACTTPPAAPSEVRVTTLPDGSTQISWRDNSNVEDGFEAWFLSEVCDWGECWYEQVPYRVGPNTTSLISGNSRFHGMHAVKDGGYSDWVPSPAGAAVSGSSAALSARVLGQHRPRPTPRWD